MELDEIKQYSHKILQININNKNNVSKSAYNEAALKITIETLDNEVIRFSKQVNDGFINHQHHGNDYYLMIDNVQGLTVLYAHFFMKDLYDYEEQSNDLFFSYDFNNLTDAHLTSESNSEYTLEHIDDKIRVKSVLDKSVTGDKDPNYKAYTDIEENNNKTESGFFPLVSRYRNPNEHSNYNAPLGSHENEDGVIINDELGQSKNPQWYKNNKNMPTWEIKIPRTELGNLIKADTNKEIYPINVYINYQYLPTSTEYHQHFYGFEDVTTDCKSVNVFDNVNINTVNDNFPNSTYSIINAKHKADNRYTMTVDHSHVIPIDFTNYNIYDESCSWERNMCDEYWVYKTLEHDGDQEGLYFDVQLKPNTSYVLKYYVWIPYDVDLSNGPCEVSVCYYEKNSQVYIGKLHEAFIKQDDILRKTIGWIYHEIPFTTSVKSNQIIIKGPKKVNDEIFFTDMVIEEIIPYSPTLKYTSNDLIISEGSTYQKKPNGQESCQDVPNATNSWSKKKNISDIKPHKYAYVVLNDEFDIRYNEYSYEIVVNNTNVDIFNITDNEDVTFTKTGDFTFNNNINDSTNDSNGIFGDLFYNKAPVTVFTYGPNNSFTLQVYDDNNSRINKGYTECAITTDSSYNGTPIKDEVFYLGKKDVVNGNVLYNNINFKTLPHSNNYYLRIDYYDPCYEKVTHYYKKVSFEEEDIKIQAQIIPEEGNPVIIPTPATTGIIASNGAKYKIQNQEEFPIQINAIITTQNGALPEGYCVLSIDDEVKQNTFVNGDGIADFFLDIDDLQEEQTIKIEYYREIGEMITYIYFTIDMEEEYDIRPVVPIRFNILNNDITTQKSDTYYSISARHKDDDNNWSSDNCLLFDIDISDENYSNYRITLTRKYGDNTPILQKIDGNKKYINVYEASDESIIIGDYYIPGEGLTKYTGNVIYTITTDNIGNNNKYRPYSKSITVNWI